MIKELCQRDLPLQEMFLIFSKVKTLKLEKLKWPHLNAIMFGMCISNRRLKT